MFLPIQFLGVHFMKFIESQYDSSNIKSVLGNPINYLLLTSACQYNYRKWRMDIAAGGYKVGGVVCCCCMNISSGGLITTAAYKRVRESFI